MSFKLSDKQRELVSAAVEREDRLLPSQLKGGAAQKVAAKLVAAGLVKESKQRLGRRSGVETRRPNRRMRSSSLPPGRTRLRPTVRLNRKWSARL